MSLLMMGAGRSSIPVAAAGNTFKPKAIDTDNSTAYMLANGWSWQPTLDFTVVRIMKVNTYPGATTFLTQIDASGNQSHVSYVFAANSMSGYLRGADGVNRNYDYLIDVGNEPSVGEWFCIAESYDMSSNQLRTAWFYEFETDTWTDIVDTGTLSTESANKTWTRLTLGGNAAGNSRVDSEHSLFYACDGFIDFDTLSNREKFIDADGLQVELTSAAWPNGTEPELLFQSDVSKADFYINKGSISLTATDPNSGILETTGPNGV